MAKGNEQSEKIDVFETFASVMRWTMILSVIALDAEKEWNLHHLDVITIFLNGLLMKEVYKIISPGFPNARRICKLV